MDSSLNSMISSLFSVNFALVSSESSRNQVSRRFKCSLGSLLRLLPDINDVSGNIKDPSNATVHSVIRVRLNLVDLEDLSGSQQPQSSKAIESLRNKQQLMAVASFHPSLEEDKTNDNNNGSLKSPSDSTVTSSPWFDSWRESFLSSLDRFDHEFIGCFFGCVFVLTSSQLDDFRQEITNLQFRVNSCSSRLKFFFASFVRYFVVLHIDSSISVNEVLAKQSFQDLNAMYGSSNVFLFDVSSPAIIVTLEKEEEEVQTPVEEVKQQLNSMSLDNKNHTSNHYIHPEPALNPTPLLDPLSPLLETLPSFSSRETASLDVDVIGNDFINNEFIHQKHKNVKPVVSQELLILTDKCLRQLIESCLIPFIDKEVKFLYDAISARKGIRKSFKQFLGMIPEMTSSSVIKGPINLIYRLESDEMQLRKIADMVMSVGLYELAHKFYHSARDDFRSDGACIYFAGASEMTGVTAFLINKLSRDKHHYFDQALTTYLDVCKNYDLSCRCCLLTSDCIRLLHPNETAHFFIRMTSEDCDLRSALFLEQAALCFRESINGRKRKASFHYVLAGHRYNKSNLKKHALHCYRQFDHHAWYSAIEHVNFTVVKLLLSLAASNNASGSSQSLESVDSNLKTSLRRQALELLKRNADKVVFFQDLMKELKSDTQGPINEVVKLNIPFVRRIRKESVEGTFVRKDGRQSCFLQEPLTLHMDISNSFPIRLFNVSLFSDQSGVCHCHPLPAVDLEGEMKEKSVTFSLTPCKKGNFDVLGMEYTTETGVKCRSYFGEKLLSRLRFLSIQTLPPVQINIKVGSNADNVDAVEMMSGELSQLDIRVHRLQSEYNDNWNPSKIILSTTGQLFRNGVEIASQRNTHHQLQPSPAVTAIPLLWTESNVFDIRSPIDSRPHLITFKVEYFDDVKKESRTITRSIEIYVRECLVIEAVIDRVVSLRNTLSSGPIILKTMSLEKNNSEKTEEESLELWPGLTAHILVIDSLISWSSFSRQGFLSLDDTIASAPKEGSFLQTVSL